MQEGVGMKLHSLMDKVSSRQTLCRAYRFGARRASASGSDGVSWSRYRQNLNVHLAQLGEKLLRGTYRPAPYKVLTRADALGKQRDFSIPTVEDRVVQRAIRLCVEPFYETCVFTDCSFEYRPKRCPRMAIKVIERFIQQGFSWVLEVDIEAFFPSVSRHILDVLLAQHIADGKFLRLVQHCLGDCPEGLPVGNGLSPFLSNIYLHEADAKLRLLSRNHLRFCDTFLLFVQTQEEMPSVHALIQQLLQELGLRLNEEKTRRWHASNIQALIQRWDTTL